MARKVGYWEIIRKLERCWSVTYGTEQTAEAELAGRITPPDERLIVGYALLHPHRRSRVCNLIASE